MQGFGTRLLPAALLPTSFSIIVSCFETNWWTIGLACALVILLWGWLPTTRIWNTDHRPLGIAAIPKIRGWLPGNLDILWQLIYGETHGYCGEKLRMWAEDYGPTYDLHILFGHQHLKIITADPANVKHILANDFDSFGKGVKFHAMFKSFLGSGIFTTDGDAWRYHRGVARPFFSAEHTSDFECFANHASKALNVMCDLSDQDRPFDIQDLFSRLTLDIGTDFLFGHSVESIVENLPTNSQFGRSYNAFSEAFNTMSKIVMRRVRIGSLWRIFELGKDPTTKPMAVIENYIAPVIGSSIAARETNFGLGERTFLDHLVKSTEDPRLISDQLLNMLLAARDTTASFLTFVTYVLALHPEITRSLRLEIHRTVGERQPALSDIRQMKYLRAVLNEVLRLFPPVPFNIRRCIKSSNLPSPLSKLGPFNITPGVSITYSPLLIQRRTDLWGNSACTFDPGRWLREDPKIHVTNPFAFLPFNGGPRMCLGQQFAYNECSYFVIRMLQTFVTLELAPEAQPVNSRPPTSWLNSNVERQGIEKCWPAASLTLYSKGGLWIRAKAT